MATDEEIVNLALVQIGADRITSLTQETKNAREANAIYDLVRDATLRAHPWNFAIKRVALNTADVFKGSGLDDLTSGGTLTGGVPINYRVQIDAAGTPDTFKWSDDGGANWDVETVAITGAAQTLNNGITITFAATTGHTVTEYWDFSETVDPAFGYDNSFALPPDNLRILEVDERDTEFKKEGQLFLTDSASPEVRYIAQITDPSKFDSLFVDAFAALLAANLAYIITGFRTVEAQKIELFKSKLAEARATDGQEGTPVDVIDDEWILARSE